MSEAPAISPPSQHCEKPLNSVFGIFFPDITASEHTHTFIKTSLLLEALMGNNLSVPEFLKEKKGKQHNPWGFSRLFPLHCCRDGLVISILLDDKQNLRIL